MIPPSNVAELREAWRATQHRAALAAPPNLRIINAAGTARVYVHGLIGFDDDPGKFVADIHDITAKTIDLHVNSPGGFVFDAVAILEALRSHPSPVTTHVDGLAASAASVVALAGDAIETAKGSRWMIHDAHMLAYADPAGLREIADLGDSISNDVAAMYADRAGGKPAAWRAAMTATTWYSAAQAVDAGLADRISGTTPSGPDNRTRLIQARARALAA